MCVCVCAIDVLQMSESKELDVLSVGRKAHIAFCTA